ncbi:MAG TPA: hypothetical protein VIG90_09610 [Pedomonas sp.]|uniref:phage fiber-tail adaptor protein n=1 Tax=Pedomonas sp. TaxID=2976421 RepID=UPI002F406BB3
MFRMKPSSADLDYPITWDLAEGDSIVSSTWAAMPIGLPGEGDMAIKAGSQIIEGETTACLLTGGREGRRYRVTTTITTAQGRTDVRSQLFRIGDVEVQA